MQSYHFLKRIFMLVNLLKIQFSLSSLKNRNMTFSLNGVLTLLIGDINRTQKLWIYNWGKKISTLLYLRIRVWVFVFSE